MLHHKKKERKAMDKKFYTVIFVFLLFLVMPTVVIGNSFFIPDTSKQDTVKKEKPDFSSVDVVVEYDWSGPEKNIGVDVFVKKENGKPAVIIMIKGEVRRCEVELISGVVVKIYDPKTNKILKTYK